MRPLRAGVFLESVEHVPPLNPQLMTLLEKQVTYISPTTGQTVTGPAEEDRFALLGPVPLPMQLGLIRKSNSRLVGNYLLKVIHLCLADGVSADSVMVGFFAPVIFIKASRLI